MKKIILTGFQPFGNYQYNPTEKLAEYYNNKTVTGKEKIIGIVLPCTYFGAFEVLKETIQKENPCAIISTGLSSSLSKIRIEAYFSNRMYSKYADANGYKPKRDRITYGKDAIKKINSSADNVFLADLLQGNEIPVELSEHANNFICNSLGYLTSLNILEKKLPIRNMFMHIPWTDDYKSLIPPEDSKVFLPKEQLYSAIELLAEHI